jgi:acetolactate synthase-1/2/3 large subunit
MLKAKRPVLYVRWGRSGGGAYEEIRQLAERLNLPTTCTLMGLGAFPASHPLSLGMLGMHGGYWTNMAVDTSDLLISIGARFDDRVTGKLDQFARGAKIIHVDIDPSCIGKNVKADIPWLVMPGLSRDNFLPKRPKQLEAGAHVADRTPWLEQIATWRREHSILLYRRGRCDQAAARDRGVARDNRGQRCGLGRCRPASDVDRTTLRFERPRQWLNSGGLGSDGIRIPAAIGAAVARPMSGSSQLSEMAVSR